MAAGERGGAYLGRVTPLIKLVRLFFIRGVKGHQIWQSEGAMKLSAAYVAF